MENDYKKMWYTLVDRLSLVLLGFKTSDNMPNGMGNFLGNYASGVVEGILQYMKELDGDNDTEQSLSTYEADWKELKESIVKSVETLSDNIVKEEEELSNKGNHNKGAILYDSIVVDTLKSVIDTMEERDRKRRDESKENG